MKLWEIQLAEAKRVRDEALGELERVCAERDEMMAVLKLAEEWAVKYPLGGGMDNRAADDIALRIAAVLHREGIS